MPNRDLDDDAVNPDEDVLGSRDDEDDLLDDDEEEEFEDDDEEAELTGEVGSEGGSPGETVERTRSRANTRGSEAEGIDADEDEDIRTLRDTSGTQRRRPF